MALHSEENTVIFLSQIHAIQIGTAMPNSLSATIMEINISAVRKAIRYFAALRMEISLK
jgi:hypothetical protein